MEKDSFFTYQQQLDTVPFQQSRGWLQFNARSNNAVFYTDDAENPTFMVWGNVFKVRPGIRILRIQGESYKEAVDWDKVTEMFLSIFEEGYSMVLLSSIMINNPDYELAVRRAGFVRPLGSSACPLTILVDLRDTDSRHRAWRKNLKKGEKAGLCFSRIETPTREHCATFARMFAEMSAYKHLDYLLTEDELVQLFQDPDFLLYLVSTPDGEVCAGRIVWRFKKFSHDVFAANTMTARQNGASYFLMENVFADLQAQGCEVFDFSRIGPGLGSANSVYEFKTFSGGKVVQYNGEWCRARGKWLELFLAFFRYGLKKTPRY